MLGGLSFRGISVGSGRRATQLATWTIRRARRIWQRATGWLGEGEGLSWWLRLAVLFGLAALLRKVATAVAAALYHRVEDGGAPWLMFGAATWWIVSAYRAGADGWTPRRPAAPTEEVLEEQPTPEDDAQPDDDTPSRLASLRREMAFALHAVGAPHAHISALAEHLGAPTDRVRQALTEAEIPIAGGVRMKGRPVAVSPGVKREDFPPLPSPPRETDMEGALTSSNNDNNNGNNAFTTVPDAVNPVRTHVVWTKRPGG